MLFRPNPGLFKLNSTVVAYEVNSSFNTFPFSRGFPFYMNALPTDGVTPRVMPPPTCLEGPTSRIGIRNISQFHFYSYILLVSGFFVLDERLIRGRTMIVGLPSIINVRVIIIWPND